jgi:dihydroorotase
MNHELVLEGKAFLNHNFQQCCIGIDEGKITEIKKILKGDRHHHFSKEILLPAGIDVHVHFRDPGMTYKESFLSGSVSAAFGGISCVFDMPNTLPATTTPDLIADKQRIANQKSIIDFGLYAGITEEAISKSLEFSKTVSLSHGLKIFLGETTNSLTLPLNHLKEIFKYIETAHKPVLIHAEDNSCLRKHKQREQNLYEHHAARPPECEIKAIEKVISAAKQVETAVHICHVSSALALDLLKNRPHCMSYGITPHHSLLHNEMDNIPNSWLKVNPPIRPKHDQKTIFERVRSGDVFLLESDHAPHSRKEKDADFSEAPCGIPGVETMYPLYLALAEKQQIPYQRIISLLCENPSKLMNISKGYISVGYDADIIVIDRKNIVKIKNENLHSKSDCSPYEGFSALFPSIVFIRGKTVIEAKEQQVSKGYGLMVPLNKSEFLTED